jgi:hypothetical protein
LAIKLVESGRFEFPKVCIFGDGCDPSVRFLNPLHRSEEYKKSLNMCSNLDDVDIPLDKVNALKAREREKVLSARSSLSGCMSRIVSP